jgi:glycosyltransferase involved in cell wall biosynthesis
MVDIKSKTKVKSRRVPVPEHFGSVEEAAEFWDTHDSADYEDYMKDVRDEEETLISQLPTADAGEAPDISVFLPVYNEEPNLRPLHAKLDEALRALGRTAEIIYVDDGSSDGSLEVLRGLAHVDPRVRVIALRRNYGQTAAMAAGIDNARGRVLIPMDADLQNDPADIVRLLVKLDQGYDVVSGWRKNRQDKLITRKLPSMLANRLISWIGGVPLHDYGCSLKAYRRESLEDVRLYGEMHRFIPIYASWAGARVTEIPVEHHPRTMGTSKYGLSRTHKVVFDLMTIKFMASYGTKPIYVFGTFGVLAFAISFFAGLYAVFLKIFHRADFVQTPLPILAIVMFAVGVQFLLMGLLAEMLVRIYHESQAKRIYAVREKIGVKGIKQ